jgi:hypothetical protein
VLVRLRNLGHVDLIEQTNSCSGVRRRSRERPLCGCCSQCLDRRFASLAADAEEFDPPERYEVDLFLGARERGQDRTTAHDWTRHALHLGAMDLADFTTRYAAELADVAAGYHDRLPGQVLSDAFQMHRRHSGFVHGVAEKAISDVADSILKSTVTPNSLLASLVRAGVPITPLAGHTIDPDEDSQDSDALHSSFPCGLCSIRREGRISGSRGWATSAVHIWRSWAS